MAKLLAINVGEHSDDVVITAPSDATPHVTFLMNDAVTKSEALELLEEIKGRLLQESNPPTVT